MNNTDGSPRVRRRDRLRSFAQSTTMVIKQEINKYYVSPSPSLSLRTMSFYSTTSSSASSVRHMSRSISEGQPQSTEVKRTETQEIDDILEDSIPELVQPQCMLFPTYANQVESEENNGVQWKIVLAGWAFAKPNSGRLDRWLLGRVIYYKRVIGRMCIEHLFVEWISRRQNIWWIVSKLCRG